MTSPDRTPLPRFPVLWLAGGAASGKTAVARRLAAAHRLRLYSADERFEDHRRRADPRRQAAFLRLAARRPEELFDRPPAALAAELLAFYRDEAALVLEDLAALPPGPPVVVEGTGVLLAALAATGAGGQPKGGVGPTGNPFGGRGHGGSAEPEAQNAAAVRRPSSRAQPADRGLPAAGWVWLAAGAAFRRRVCRRRPATGEVLARCPDPALAWRRWMGRDDRVAAALAARARAAGVPAVAVDGRRGEAATAAEVARRLGLPGPTQLDWGR